MINWRAAVSEWSMVYFLSVACVAVLCRAAQLLLPTLRSFWGSY